MSRFMVAGSSFTPFRSTVWLPSGQPASASKASAVRVAGVSSSGWLKCTLTNTGWNFLIVSQSAGVIRSGRCEGIRVWIRTISTWEIARSLPRKYSTRRSESIRGSPPESATSRTSVCCWR